MNTHYNDLICAICEHPGNLIQCSGDCLLSYHKECLGLTSNPSGPWTCSDCAKGEHVCYTCNRRVSDHESIICSIPTCRRRFHWKRECCGQNTAEVFSENYVCPCHVCDGCKMREEHQNQLIKCFRCTKAYHEVCLPSNAIRLDQKYFKCQSHYSEPPQTNMGSYHLASPYQQSAVYPPQSSSYSARSPYSQPPQNPSMYQQPGYSHSPLPPPPPLQQQQQQQQPPFDYMFEPPNAYGSPPLPSLSSSSASYNQPVAHAMPLPSHSYNMSMPMSMPTDMQGQMQGGRSPFPPQKRFDGGLPPAPKRPKQGLTEEQKQGKSLLCLWKDLRRAGIELTDKRINERKRILEKVIKTRDEQKNSMKRVIDKFSQEV